MTKDWADLTMGNGIGDAIADHGNAAVSWQSRSLEWLLRALVKGRLGPGIDFIALRRRLEHVDRLLFGMPRNARCTPLEASGVQSEWIEVPQTRPERVLLYFHGGGFAVRSPNLYRRFVARISRRLRTRALLVDYRLAPEHPFPAGVDDCLTAYRWLLDQHVAPQNIVVAGDSAGANLALVTLLRAKAARLPQPACAFVISPPVDFTFSSASFAENKQSDAVCRLETLLALRQRYVDADRLRDPSVSPLFGDFAGLPPLLMQTGAREMLRDDAVRIAERAHGAGTDVELEVWNGMQHCFQLLSFLPESERAVTSIVRFARRHTGWSPEH